MNLTPRLKQILIVMLKEDQVISVKELGDRIGVSKRTVQRELEYLGNVLDTHRITFETKTGKGVWLEGSPEDKVALLQELEESDCFDVSNRKERRKRLILEILKEKGLKKLFYYASQFKVSEATISSDLEAIEGWLNEQHLKIIRKPGSGVQIVGSEESYRRAISTFIEENIDTQVIQDSYKVDDFLDGRKSLCGTGIGMLLQDDILKRVVNCISSIQDKRVLTLTENSYLGLVLHISIAINRILQNDIVEQNDTWKEEMPKDEDYELAALIVEMLEKEFGIEIPKTEIDYICLHIKGAKHQTITWNGQKIVEIQKKELINIVNEMIDMFDRDIAVMLKQDDEFIQGLLAHLQPTFIRLMHNMKISNPVLDDIKELYPEIYEKSKQAAKVLEKWMGKPVPEAEIGFLTIHFGAAQERIEGRKESIRQVEVGIICASGIGISRLMLSKLEKVFKGQLKMKTYARNDITPFIIGKTDFFISSITMPPMDADIVQVNPLLNGKDIERIRKKAYEYERMPKKHQEEDGFTVELDQISIVAMQIKTILKSLEIIKVNNDISFDELVIAIAEHMSPYCDRRELIRKDLEERERIGSQVFAEFGFALFHTRTKGVTRPSFTVCTTKDKKMFSDPYFKQINVVLVMLLPIDDHIRVNSEILGYISGMLIEDFDFLTTIAGGNKEEIYAVLSKHLKIFFNQYLNGE